MSLLRINNLPRCMVCTSYSRAWAWLLMILRTHKCFASSGIDSDHGLRAGILRNCSRAFIRAKPNTLVPFHCFGSCTRGSPTSMPIPQMLSLMVASAMILSPVERRRLRMLGLAANFWYTTSKATSSRCSFHNCWSKG